MPRKGKTQIKCVKCGKEYFIRRDSYAQKKYDVNPVICTICTKTSPEVKAKIANAITNKFKDPTYSTNQREGIRKLYQNKSYCAKIASHLSRINKNKELIQKRKDTYEETLATTDARLKLSHRSKIMWQSEKFRNAVMVGMMKNDVRLKMAAARERQPKTSSLEDTVAKILTDLGLKFERSKQIAFYHFDFYIERQNVKPLLLEIQGDYWHNLSKGIKNDKAKATYYQRYLKNQMDLKYIWEHEFLCDKRITNQLIFWTAPKQYEFDFNEIKIDFPTIEETKIFLRAYHYLGYKIGFNVGAYYKNNLIALATFSSPVRIESVTTENFKFREVLELSRFCIATGFNKKNFASWFLSRCRNVVFQKFSIKAIISFADKTLNHTGAIYFADNWQYKGDIPADYWYVDKDGYYMHKKTLWNHAVRMQMKEIEFAQQYDYTKVMGLGKMKFIIEREKTP